MAWRRLRLRWWKENLLRWDEKPVLHMLTRTGVKIMRKVIFALAVAALVTPPALAQVHVKGYTKKDGTYVAPYYRSSPNNSVSDNYSTKGNVNPYTGKAGTKDPYAAPATSTYRSPYSTPKVTTPCYFNCPE